MGTGVYGSLSVWNLTLKSSIFFVQVGVIDFSMYLKNDIDDYRSEERFDPSLSASYILSSSLSAALYSCFMSVSMATGIAR